MGVRLTLALIALAGTAQAEELSLACAGDGWSLSISGLQARLNFPSPTDMNIPSVVVAEGAEWPRAMTLIGARDTAIVVLHDRLCTGGTHEVQVLTQRGQTPILLNGCCTETGK